MRIEVLAYDRSRGKTEAANLVASLAAARIVGYELPEDVERAAERMRAWAEESWEGAAAKWRELIEAEQGSAQDESGWQ